MFYEFNQNNSGGSFITNDKVCHRLFIEADNVREAVRKAEDLGCYWDGVSKGIDCSCCGDRWYKPWGDDGVTIPEEYSVSDYGSLNDWNKKYGKYEIVEEPHVRKSSMFKYYEGKIRLHSLEEYVQFLADNYGWTAPDARIYYKNGDVKEFFKS